MKFECFDRDTQLLNGDPQRDDQKEQCDPECVKRDGLQSDVDEKGANDAKKEAAHPEYLHGTGHVEPFAQILQLLLRDRGRIVLVFLFQVAYHLGIGQKPVGIGQHDQRYG